MLPSSLSSILAFVLLRGAPVVEPPVVAACEDVQRVELALASTAAEREICVSPGLMTSLRFDAAVVVELQDEVRFEEVVRARRVLTLLPPPDMVPGERLRLKVRFEGDAPSNGVTFVLVAHSGLATRQVEVYRDKRTRESFEQEVLQERARTRQLREELVRVRTLLEQAGGLRSLIASKKMGTSGVLVRRFDKEVLGLSDVGLSLSAGVIYRADKIVAAEVLLKNSDSEPWTVAGASLVDAHGEGMRGVEFLQEEPIPPDGTRAVIVEVDALREEARGEMTLKLWDAGGRTITIPNVTFP